MASRTCCLQKGPNYRDVVIIGNGPSAITLSYLLHGYRPYYNGGIISNTILAAKLQETKGSLVNQDLEFLSEGLEGRSSNPVALLWDALTHPDADYGAVIPSLLKWQYEADTAISHAVLGKFKPGGSWQRMEGNMQTISQNSWMELPGLPFKQWLDSRDRNSTFKSGRATVGDVRDYYQEYVDIMNLRDHFKDFHVVTSVQKVFDRRSCADNDSGEMEPCCQNIRQNHRFLWEVRGYRVIPSVDDQKGLKTEAKEEQSNGSSGSNNDFAASSGREDFCYITSNVVLATGAYDVPNKLGITGENLPNVIHSLCAFEKKLLDGDFIGASAPVCIIGAGLSAADAILMALEAGIPVVHVFRRSANDPNMIFKKLPHSIYPEYHQVAMLMKGELKHELYHAYPQHRVAEICQQMILLKPPSQHSSSSRSRSISPPTIDSTIISVDTSCTVVLIGSRPDLSFLPGGGKNLGLVPKWQIDSKHNPIDVDPFSYQSTRERGLYAMGPLIGDNFVRFGIGGALGVTNHFFRMGQAANM